MSSQPRIVFLLSYFLIRGLSIAAAIIWQKGDTRQLVELLIHPRPHGHPLVVFDVDGAARLVFTPFIL